MKWDIVSPAYIGLSHLMNRKPIWKRFVVPVFPRMESRRFGVNDLLYLTIFTRINFFDLTEVCQKILYGTESQFDPVRKTPFYADEINHKTDIDFKGKRH